MPTTAREPGDIVSPLRSRLSLHCASVLEACWLLAVVVAPLHFNVYSSRVFEPDKAVLVRALALVALLVWLLRCAVDRGLPAARLAGLRQPLFPAVAAVMASTALSTALSIAPTASLFGSFERLQGTLTTLSYVVLFLALVGHMRERAQVERFLTVVVVASLPVALYGIVQRAQLDPLPWGQDTAQRVSSTLGNAAFVAAYLVMASMVAMGRAVLALRAAIVERERRLASAARAVLYLCILLADLVTIAWSGSRGPLLGWLAGSYLFLVLLALHWRRRWLAWVALGLAAGALAFLLLLNLPDGPLERTKRRMPALARMGSILEAESGSARVRVLLWGGARRMLQSHEPLRFPDGRADRWHPLRPWVGYGPETLRVAYNRFYPPEIAQHEQRLALPDRLHNEAWDTLAATGLVGLLAYLALYTGIFGRGLGWLGLGNGRARRLAALGAIVLGGGVGAVAAAGARGAEFAGVGLPLGMLAGLGGLVTLSALVRRPPVAAATESWRAVALIGLFCALVARFVDTSFGVAGVVSHTHFWTFLAVLLVVGHVLPGGSGAPDPPRASRAGGGWPAIGASAAVATGPLLVLGFDFIGNPGRLTDPARIVAGALTATPAILGLFGLTWLGGGILARLEDDRAARRPHDWRGVAGVLGVALVVSAAGWLAIGRHLASIAAAAPATVSQIAEAVGRVAGLVDLQYALLAALAVAWALCLSARRAAERRRAGISSALSLPIALVATIVLFFVSGALNLPPVRADILAKAGLDAAARAQYPLADGLFARALALAPGQDVYWSFRGRAQSSAAAAITDPLQRDAFFGNARSALVRARRLNPLHVDHTVSLARLMRDWGSGTSDPERRRASFAEADRLYEAATRLAPNSAWIWNEWAALLLRDVGDLDGARAKLDRSLELDALFEETRRLRAELQLAEARGARSSQAGGR